MKITKIPLCTLFFITASLVSQEHDNPKTHPQLSDQTCAQEALQPNVLEKTNEEAEATNTPEPLQTLTTLVNNHIQTRSALYSAFLQNPPSAAKEPTLFNQLIAIAINTSDKTLYDMLLFSRHLELIQKNKDTLPTTFDMTEEALSKGSLPLLALLIQQGAPTVTPHNESLVAIFIDRYNVALAHFINQKNIANNGTDFESEKWQSDEQFSVMHALKMLHILLQGRDVDFNARYRDGRTILDHARTPEVMQLLLKHITAQQSTSKSDVQE